MSNETLAAKARQGDEAALLALWENVQRFVIREANRWARAWPKAEMDDLEQSAFLALMDAVQTFCPEKGCTFLSWYGSYALKTAFADVAGIRTSRKDPLDNSLSLDAPLDDEGHTVLSDTVPSPVNDIEAAEERIYREELHGALQEEMGRLPDLERQLLTGVYYEGKPRKQLAEVCGFSLGQIRRIEQRALSSLRKSKALQEYIAERVNYYERGGIHTVENILVQKELATWHFEREYVPAPLT